MHMRSATKQFFSGLTVLILLAACASGVTPSLSAPPAAPSIAAATAAPSPIGLAATFIQTMSNGGPVSLQAPPDAWTAFTSKRFGYSAAYPASWTVQETEPGGDIFGPTGRTLVLVASLPVGSTSLASFRDQVVASYKAKPGQPDSDTDTKIAGSPARLLVYHMMNEAGQPIFLYGVVTVHNNTGWELLFGDLMDHESADSADFQTFAAIFAFAK